MTLGAVAQHKNNLEIGAGAWFIDELDESGERTGERFVGDSDGGTLNIEVEEVLKMSGTGAVAKELLRAPISVSRAFNLTLNDMSMENLRILALGDAVSDSPAIAATAVRQEEVKVKKGRWYQLGQTKARPGGVPAVTSTIFTIKPALGTSEPWTSGEDFVLDKEAGRFYVVPGGDIPDDVNVYVDYMPVAQAAGARKIVSTSSPRAFLAALRYVEDADSQGQGRNFYAPRCSIIPSDALTIQSREAIQSLNIVCRILDPGDGVAGLTIDGKEV